MTALNVIVDVDGLHVDTALFQLKFVCGMGLYVSMWEGKPKCRLRFSSGFNNCGQQRIVKMITFFILTAQTTGARHLGNLAPVSYQVSPQQPILIRSLGTS